MKCSFTPPSFHCLLPLILIFGITAVPSESETRTMEIVVDEASEIRSFTIALNEIRLEIKQGRLEEAERLINKYETGRTEEKIPLAVALDSRLELAEAYRASGKLNEALRIYRSVPQFKLCCN